MIVYILAVHVSCGRSGNHSDLVAVAVAEIEIVWFTVCIIGGVGAVEVVKVVSW